MKTKKIILLLVIIIFSTKMALSQVNPNFEFKNKVRDEIGSVKKVDKFEDEDLKKTVHVRYLHQDYKKAYISKSKEIYFLRYNIFTDEMEYVNNNNVYNLNKSENKVIDFFEIKTKYGVFNLNNELNYLMIINNGKNSVLSKQHVMFDEGKKAVTQFDVKVPPKFIRQKDEYYIAFNNTNLVSVPKSKKAFYKLFKDKASVMKKYVSQEKLSHKKIDDLVKIVEYYNSL